MARHDLPFIIYKYFFISAILLVIVRSDLVRYEKCTKI